MNALRILFAGIAVSALAWLSPAAAQQKTFKVVMHSDLKVLDPVWSGAYIVRNHGYLIYDTLFAIDEQFQVKPQMAESWQLSEDGLDRDPARLADHVADHQHAAGALGPGCVAIRRVAEAGSPDGAAVRVCIHARIVAGGERRAPRGPGPGRLPRSETYL